MASRDKKDLNELCVSAHEKAAAEYKDLYPTDPQPFIVCTHRSEQEQAALFNQPTDGVDNNGNGVIDDKGEKVTQAKPGQSPHNFLPSPAWDIAFINVRQKLDYNIELFKKYAELVKKHQPLIEWGGDWKFKDAPHFQLKDWRKFVTNQNQIT